MQLHYFTFAAGTAEQEVTLIDKILSNCEGIKTSVINILSAHTAATEKGKFPVSVLMKLNNYNNYLQNLKKKVKGGNIYDITYVNLR